MKTIPFMKWRWLAVALSGIALLTAVACHAAITSTSHLTFRPRIDVLRLDGNALELLKNFRLPCATLGLRLDALYVADECVEHVVVVLLATFRIFGVGRGVVDFYTASNRLKNVRKDACFLDVCHVCFLPASEGSPDGIRGVK